jgi:hypothetical protein
MWKIWDEVEGTPNCGGFQDRDWVRGVGFSGSGGKLGCGRNGTKAKGPAAGASPPTLSPSIMTADTGLEMQGTGVDVEWTLTLATLWRAHGRGLGVDGRRDFGVVVS